MAGAAGDVGFHQHADGLLPGGNPLLSMAVLVELVPLIHRQLVDFVFHATEIVIDGQFLPRPRGTGAIPIGTLRTVPWGTVAALRPGTTLRSFAAFGPRGALGASRTFAAITPLGSFPITRRFVVMVVVIQGTGFRPLDALNRAFRGTTLTPATTPTPPRTPGTIALVPFGSACGGRGCVILDKRQILVWKFAKIVIGLATATSFRLGRAAGLRSGSTVGAIAAGTGRRSAAGLGGWLVLFGIVKVVFMIDEGAFVIKISLGAGGDALHAFAIAATTATPTPPAATPRLVFIAGAVGPLAQVRFVGVGLGNGIVVQAAGGGFLTPGRLSSRGRFGPPRGGFFATRDRLLSRRLIPRWLFELSLVIEQTRPKTPSCGW